MIGKTRTITLTVDHSIHYNDGYTIVYGTAKTMPTVSNPNEKVFSVWGAGKSGPELPPEITSPSLGKSPVILKVTGIIQNIDHESLSLSMNNCSFELKNYPPALPYRIIKKTHLPTKAAKREYDLLQKAYLGGIFQQADIKNPHIKADRIYSKLSELIKNIPELKASLGDSQYPIYNEPWAYCILRSVPEIFDYMHYPPKETDRIMKYLNKYNEYKHSRLHFSVWGNHILENLPGDTWIVTSKLLSTIRSNTKSNMSDDEICIAIHANSYARFKIDADKSYLTYVRSSEKYIAQKLNLISHDEYDVSSEFTIKSMLKLSPEQKEAVKGICSLYNSGGVALVTGGPGTGKTSIIRTVLSALVSQGVNPSEIALAAPTGKAAKRLADISGFEAKTLHRLLEVDPVQGLGHYLRNFDNPLPHKMVIIDEASMIDCILLSDILSAINTDTALILLGDTDQLESIGPGSILRDILKTNHRVLKYSLNKNFRQKKGTCIITNSNRIISGDTRLETNDSFKIIRVSDIEEASSYIGNQTDIDIIDDPKSIILTHSREDAWFFNAKVLKQLEKSNRKYQIYENRAYYQGEKVIFIHNNYSHLNTQSERKKDIDQGIPCPYYNGETGHIKRMKQGQLKTDQCITIHCDDRDIRLFTADYNDILPAYAITTHKAQGSEYKNVIIFISENNYTDRNWLYTAVTRAKKSVRIISVGEALEDTILRTRPERQSLLQEDLNNAGLYETADNDPYTPKPPPISRGLILTGRLTMLGRRSLRSR